MIDEEDWSAMDVDVKGAAFEGLLEKAASEGKKGAGQYFTPRPLIQSICRVMKPDPRGKPDFTLCDPACGTGGFLVGAWEWLISKPVSGGVFDRADYFIRKKVYHGQDLVPRLAGMEMAEGARDGFVRTNVEVPDDFAIGGVEERNAETVPIARALDGACGVAFGLLEDVLGLTVTFLASRMARSWPSTKRA